MPKELIITSKQDKNKSNHQPLNALWLRISAFLSLKAPNTQTTYAGIINEFCIFLGEKAGTSEAANALINADELTVTAYRRWLDNRPGETPRSIRKAAQQNRDLRLSTKINKAKFNKKSGLETSLSNATIAKKFAALRRIYRMLQSYNIVSKNNPFASDNIPAASKDSGRKRPTEMIDYELVKQIISSPDISTDKGLRDHCILVTLFAAGLRRSELTNLRICDLKRTKRGTTYLYLRATKAKRDAEQAVPDWAAKSLWQLAELRKNERALTEDYLFISYTGQSGKTPTNKPISNSGVYKLFRHYCKILGQETWATPHSARATAITKLLDSGLSHRQVKEFSRHASIQMVELYDKRRIGIDQNPAKELDF